METIDNIEDAQPSEKQPEGVMHENIDGVQFTEESFEEAWRSVHNAFQKALHGVYEQIATPIREEMSAQIPDFSLENEEHKEMYERSVYERVAKTGAPDYFLGSVRTNLVIHSQVGKRYGFNIDEIISTLQAIDSRNSKDLNNEPK